MAFLLSVTSFTHRQSQFLGAHSSRFTGGRLKNTVASSAGRKHLFHKNSPGSLMLLNRSLNCSINAPTRQCLDPFLCHFGECFSANVLIFGFWMGPDIEDGWGFVEASVHRID